MRPITATTFYADPSSPTRVAAQPAPEVLVDHTQPYIGKTTEYEVVVERTPSAHAPEVTENAAYDEEGHHGYPEIDHTPNRVEDESAYTTIRRTTSPGIRPPRGWLW